MAWLGDAGWDSGSSGCPCTDRANKAMAGELFLKQHLSRGTKQLMSAVAAIRTAAAQSSAGAEKR